MTLLAADVEGILAEVLPAEVWALHHDRELGQALARYLEVLVRWNRTVNLTSVRTPEEMVRRHVAESLCCAAALPSCGSVLDLGSGAGFPGIPVQLARPELRVTMAESHGKKAAFLHEVVRELGLRAEVFAERAQELPPRSFGCVCLRAVDPMRQALEAATMLADRWICVIGSAARMEEYGAGLQEWELVGMPAAVRGGGSAIFLYGRGD